MRTAIVMFFLSIISMTISLPLVGEKLRYEWFHNIEDKKSKEISFKKEVWYRTVRFVGKMLLLYGLLLLLIAMFFATIKFDPLSKKFILFITIGFPIIMGVVMTILYVNRVTKEIGGKLTVF